MIHLLKYRKSPINMEEMLEWHFRFYIFAFIVYNKEFTTWSGKQPGCIWPRERCQTFGSFFSISLVKVQNLILRTGLIDREICYDDAGHFLVTLIDCNIACVAGTRRGDWGGRELPCPLSPTPSPRAGYAGWLQYVTMYELKIGDSSFFLRQFSCR